MQIKEHKSSSWILDKEATEEENGKRHKECLVCGSILEEDDIKYTKVKLNCNGFGCNGFFDGVLIPITSFLLLAFIIRILFRRN